ncbi:hypothetical protein PRZ48_013567 [Zasmidium cellare]|uniref:Maleylacetoacetate isomerase n=1 Tax=Zasmidium cellare TaxID=395010 RepID=A0ABR0E265_ZASCE|nr:hypothetical protein PRZ48_013567 [Zasmidium cellare]
MDASSTTPELTLYSSRISNASTRLPIALNLKQLPYKLVTINLSKHEQHDIAFKVLNPAGTVPLLIHHHDGSAKPTIIGQSIAALEYLDEAFPNTKPLLPRDAASRARVRSLVALLAGDMHPLLTHRVSKAIRDLFPETETSDGTAAWHKHWVHDGMSKFEAVLAQSTVSGRFCVGDEITLADVVLLPEVWFARRIGVQVSDFPRIEEICTRLCVVHEVRKEEQTLEG